MSYGRFEAAYLDQGSELREQFRLVILPLRGFHPKTRPVFWRMLVTQVHLYEALLRVHTAEAPSAVDDRVLDLVPEVKRERFDWRGHQGEATDEEVLVQPFAVRSDLPRESPREASSGQVKTGEMEQGSDFSP